MITMSKLIQKVKWSLDGSQAEMYMYGEADFEANKAMQEPLEKLYKYENKPDMRDKVREYIGELETEIDRLALYLGQHLSKEGCGVTEIETRIIVLRKVINDLNGRFEGMDKVNKI